MSFYQNVYGNLPQSGFTYTSNNVSTDNVICENLSAVNASIVNLTTAVFQPISITTVELTANEINASIINASHMHISNISMDGTLGGDTANLVTLNADHAIVDGLYINEQSAVLTDKSLVKRDANQVNFIGKSNASDANGADFLFRTGKETDAVKLTISRTSDIVGAIALAVDTTIEGNTGIFDTLNVSTLNVSNSVDFTMINASMINASNLSAINASVDNALNVRFAVKCGSVNASTSVTAPKLNSTNISTTNISATRITGDTADFVTVNAENNVTDALYLNEQSAVLTDKSLVKRDANQIKFIGKNSSTDINGADYLFRTGEETDAVKLTISRTSDIVGAIALAVDTTIEGDSGIFNTLNVSTLNASMINASNISCVNLSASNDITALEVRGTAIVSSPILEGGFVDTLTGDISNLSTVNISSTLISTNTINASTVNSSAMTTVSLNTTSIFAQGAIIGATVDADILEALYEFHITDKTTGTSNQTIMHRFANYFEMYNTNVVAPYKIYTGTNTGTPDLEITSTGIVADISPNLAAGTGISLSTLAGITTITNTGTVTDPLNVSQLNASNISCVNISASNDITALEVRGTAIVSSPILEGGFVDTLTGDITNLSSTNISITNATLATSLTGAGIINTTGIIQTTGAINGGTINGNIASNLAAGNGISLSTSLGVTTISNTGGVTDPLNVSKLNASNISCDNISAASITGDIFSTLSAGGGVTISQNTPSQGITQISATALSTSTQYAFKAYSTSGDAYSINGAVTIPYNSLAPQAGYDGYSIPNTSSYNTAQATYTVPVSGYWYFGYTLRQRTTATTNALVAIYRNATIYMINGNYTGNGEGMSITLYADAGDLFYVRSLSGSFSVDMRPTAAMFYGFLLQPVNNTVTATTDLSIQSLNVTNNITATSITADLSPNLNPGLNIGLSTTSGVTTINSAQQILSLSLMNNISPGAAVGTTIIYDTIKYNSGVGLYLANPLTGEITVNQSGSYCISAAVNIFNNNYSDRVNFRIRLRLNGSWFLGFPQAYSYSRHQNYARYATSVITDHCTPLMAGDKIDIFCSVAKATNSNFTSDFSGLQLFNGATFTIKRI